MATTTTTMETPSVKIDKDHKVTFPAFFINARSKKEKRQFVAQHAETWIKMQHKRGVQGCVVFDIDDTLIDRNEKPCDGFEFMRDLYDKVSDIYPIEVVTARPNDESNVTYTLKKLKDIGFCVMLNNLHMMDRHEYDSDNWEEYVKRFKWGCHQKFVKKYGFVVARFGDKMWDIASKGGMDDTFTHIEDTHCYIFFEDSLKGTLSGKLPGRK